MFTCLFLYAVYFSMSDAVSDFVLHSRATASLLYHLENKCQHYFLYFSKIFSFFKNRNFCVNHRLFSNQLINPAKILRKLFFNF